MKRKAEQILKVDTAGRVWTPREQREAVLDEFERSGMPASKFAEHALVSERLGENARGGALFVFTNRRHTRLKVLYFEGTGLWPMTRRLEEGTFAWPRQEEIGAPKLALRPESFAMLSDGIDLRGAKMRPWFERG